MTAHRSNRILSFGFSPCIQRILEFDRLEKGAVNRAQQVRIGIGGKGANTARMITQLGGSSELIQFSGGASGRQLHALLEAEGVTFRSIETEGETRICQTLIERGSSESTELVEEMPPVTPGEWEQMEQLIDSLDLSHRMVTVSGRSPAGVPVDAYAKMAQAVTDQAGYLILDLPGEPLLKALSGCPALVKINEQELQQTLPGLDLITGCHALMERGARAVLITRGKAPAVYVDGQCMQELIPPAVDAVNAVGSGDAVTAGMAFSLANGKEVASALKFGMACGAANAAGLVSGLIDRQEVEHLVDAVVCRPFTS